MGAFGDKFRKAREAKSISLDDVSNVTKISARNLKAIEEERFDQLPGGVFNRGFIRAYAKHLGLNDEEAVSDYLSCLRQAQIDAHEVWHPESVTPVRSANAPATSRPAYQKPIVKEHAPAAAPPVPVQTDEELPELHLPRVEHVRPPSQKYLDGRKPNPPWRLVAVAAIVIVLAAVFWIRHSRATRTEAANVPGRLAAQPGAVLAPVPVAANAGVSNQPAAKNPAPASQSSVPAKSETVSQPGKPAGPAPTVPDKTTRSQTIDEGSDVTVRTFTKPAAPAKAAPTMTLVIRASETSWISVTADGQLASQETLIAPAHASIRASREIVARVGNAAGVTFLFNGQEIAAQGTEAEVKTYVFDVNGMREIQNQ